MVEFLRQPVVERLALTLLHCLWQGAAIALLLAILLKGIDRRRPGLRYAAGCIGLSLFVAAPVVTFFMVDSVTVAEEPVRFALSCLVFGAVSFGMLYNEIAVNRKKRKEIVRQTAHNSPSLGEPKDP